MHHASNIVREAIRRDEEVRNDVEVRPEPSSHVTLEFMIVTRSPERKYPIVGHEYVSVGSLMVMIETEIVSEFMGSSAKLRKVPLIMSWKAHYASQNE